MKDSFAEQYKHPKWQKRRLEMLEAFDYQCQLCYDTETELQIHHIEYVKGKKIWEYSDDYLLVLCRPCHERLTELLTDTRRKATWDVYVDTLSTLNELFTCGKRHLVASILTRLQDNPDMMHPVFEMLNTLHTQREKERNAPTISQTRNNQ